MARVSPAVGLLSTPATARWDHGHLTSIQLDELDVLYLVIKRKPLRAEAPRGNLSFALVI